MTNPLTQKDFYKTDHRRQYPEGTNMVYSNLTARSARLFKGSSLWDNKIVWFGLQRFIKEFLIKEFQDNFFDLPKGLAVGRYKRRLDTALGQGAVPVDHIEALHDLGYLPIQIYSLPEGSRVNIKVPVLTIHNTDPRFFWLTNDLETVLSTELWKPTTVATIAYEYSRLLKHYAEKTGSPLEFVQFQGHDFSMRGMSNRQDAANCGMGHLLSFTGTDTIPAIDAAEDYYNAKAEFELIGTSVPATEHSVMCMGGKGTEIETFRRLVSDVYPSGIVSIVSDTWDFWQVLTDYLPQLKETILNRPVNAIGLSKVVIRPDSGNPIDIICGLQIEKVSCKEHAGEWIVDRIKYETPHGEAGAWTATEIFDIDGKFTEVTVEIEWNRYDKQYYYEDGWKVTSAVEVELTPAQKGALRCLWDVFGGTETSTGHKLLDSHIGLIYGDSITIERAESILKRMDEMGFASANIVFGIGSFTYQYITRDTFGFAIKATYGQINGEGVELEKDPVTDNGTKKSAKGLLRVDQVGDDFVLTDQVPLDSWETNRGAMDMVYSNGLLLEDYTFQEIRETLGAL